MSHRLKLMLPLYLFLLLPGFKANADIYRYVDDDGVVCFTDSPSNKSATLVMKDRKGARAVGKGVTKPITQEQESPILPVQGRISSPMGLRNDPIDGTLREHRGVDIAAPEGSPVKPVTAGRVVYTGMRPGYGNMVTVEHGDGTTTIYAHNSVNLVAEGEDVDSGTVIALVGHTGRTTGPHLHFEAWRNGANVTSTYVPNGKGSEVSGTLAAHRPADNVRRVLQPDGTIFFTNLP